MAKAKNDCRKQWQILNEITGSKKQNRKFPEEIIINGEPVSLENDPIKYANGFNNYFANVGKTLADKIATNSCFQNKYLPPSNDHSFFASPVTEDEIKSLINSLVIGKSPGFDGITAKVVKSASYVLAPILVHLFNISFSSGVFPKVLKSTVVIPIFKKGCVKDPNNYRPIALLSVFSKLLEKAMKNRIVSFFERYNLFHCNQFGFRKNCSTEDAVQSLLNQIYTALDSNNVVLGVFLDLTKAFDTVNHKRLLNKLELYGIRGVANSWFTDYLSNRPQSTRINNYRSENVSMTMGVPQGSVLGPLLFLIYINDIYNLNTHSDITSFADDTALINVNSSKELAYNAAEQDLILVGDWFNENLLTLNIMKSNFLQFTLRRANTPENLELSMHKCSAVNPDCGCPQFKRIFLK
jgi:hypothetical protein